MAVSFNFNGENIKGFSDLETKYLYPFQELFDIFKRYECRDINSIKSHFDLEIKQFLDKVLNVFNVREEERNMVKLNYQLNITTRVSCANLFTACLLYGFSHTFRICD